MVAEEGLGFLLELFGGQVGGWLAGNFLLQVGGGKNQCFAGNWVVGVVRFGRFWQAVVDVGGLREFARLARLVGLGRFGGGGEFIHGVVEFLGDLAGFEVAEFGAAVQLGGEAAGFAEEDGEFLVVCDVDARVLGRGEAAELLEQVALEEAAQSSLEQAELFEQEIVGGLLGELAPVGLDEFEVGEDGGVGDVELLADVAQRASLLPEFVDFERSLSSSR